MTPDYYVWCPVVAQVAEMEQHDPHHLLDTFPGVHLYCTYPAQHVATAGEDLDDLSDLSGLSDLLDLSGPSGLTDLSDLSVILPDLSDL